MNKLHLSHAARRDLAEIQEYISAELENPKSAKGIVKNITKDIRVLQSFAFAGPLLSSVADVDSDYRFLVSGNYMVFYRVYESDVYVDRILYGRRDYLRILFENIIAGDATE